MLTPNIEILNELKSNFKFIKSKNILFQFFWLPLEPIYNFFNYKVLHIDRILKDELPRSVGAQHATGDQWRNNSRKNEGMEPKQKQHPAVDMTGHRSRSNAIKSNIV